MKKVIGVLFIAAVASAPAMAQQENKPSNGAVPAATQTDHAVPGFKLVIDFSLIKSGTEDGRRVQLPPETLVFTQPQWVFKDGALYMDIGGTGMLIPVPGGGASGCFDLNLRERMARLRSTIEAFPQRPR